MKQLNPKRQCTEYLCDRCGRKFAESRPLEKDPGENKVARGATLTMPVISGQEIGFRSEDFCGSCLRSLWAWRKAKKRIRPIQK